MATFRDIVDPDLCDIVDWYAATLFLHGYGRCRERTAVHSMWIAYINREPANVETARSAGLFTALQDFAFSFRGAKDVVNPPHLPSAQNPEKVRYY